MVNENFVQRIGMEPLFITGRNNVITSRYWTRRQERVKLVDYRRSRGGRDPPRTGWSTPNRRAHELMYEGIARRILGNKRFKRGGPIVNRGLKIISGTEEVQDNGPYRPQSGAPERKKKAPPGQRMLRVREAAEYLGSSPWKVRQLIAHRRIPFLQDGDGPFLLDIRDLDGFIERSKRIV